MLLTYEEDNTDAMIVASTCSTNAKGLEFANAIAIAATHAITDTGAALIFIMKGTSVKYLRGTDSFITVSLPDSSKVSSTHICDINIPGLPITSMGHFALGITMASLIEIRILCKAGCKDVFDNEKCKVFNNNDIILRGYTRPLT